MAKNFIIISLLISFLIFAQEESDPCSTAVAFDMLDAFYDDVKEPTRSSENYKTGEINLIGDDEVESVVVYKSEELQRLEEKRLQRKAEFQKELDEKRKAQNVDHQQEE